MRSRRPRSQANVMQYPTTQIPSRRILQIKRATSTVLTLPAAAGLGQFFSASPVNAINFATDFGSLFEMYRMKRVRFTFVPSTNNNDLVNLTPLDYQPMLIAWSPTITSTPASSSDLYQMESLRVKQLSEKWSVSFTPSIAVALNSGNSYVPAPSQWVSIGSSPQFNGLRLWIDNCGQAGNTTIGTMIYEFWFDLACPF